MSWLWYSNTCSKEISKKIIWFGALIVENEKSRIKERNIQPNTTKKLTN